MEAEARGAVDGPIRVKVRVQSLAHAALFQCLVDLSQEGQRQLFHDLAFSAAVLMEALVRQDPEHSQVAQVLSDARRTRVAPTVRARTAEQRLDLRVTWRATEQVLPLLNERLRLLAPGLQGKLLLALANARPALLQAVAAGLAGAGAEAEAQRKAPRRPARSDEPSIEPAVRPPKTPAAQWDTSAVEGMSVSWSI